MKLIFKEGDRVTLTKKAYSRKTGVANADYPKSARILEFWRQSFLSDMYAKLDHKLLGEKTWATRDLKRAK